jgi:hypothetical protein
VTHSKSPQEALYEVGMMNNVALILVLVGFAFFSWATIGYGFTFDSVLWLCSLLTGAGFWYVCQRFTTHPNRSLLGTLRIVMVAYVVLWITATIATVAYWEELDLATIMGVLLSAALTFLMVRVTILGAISVVHQVQPFESRPLEYGRPIQPAEPQPGIRCPVCGSQLAGGTRFCPYDGTPIPQGCPSCGQVVAAGMRFCPHCSAPQSGA